MAVQNIDLESEIEDLEDQIETLELEIESLEARNEALELTILNLHHDQHSDIENALFELGIAHTFTAAQIFQINNHIDAQRLAESYL